MARPLRIEYPDAIYHVTMRGIERRRIVADERDRRQWLNRLGHVVRLHRWRLFAFALMNNHYHLFLQTPEPNLSRGMHDLNSAYATFFNVRHQRSGHLFQGRFKAFIIEDEGYWDSVSCYVHLNPVRAALVAKPQDWRWSSYPGYHWLSQRLGWIDYARVLDDFGGDNDLGRRRYRDFIVAELARQLDSPFAKAKYGLILGSDRFVERIREKLRRQPDDPEVPPLARMRLRPDLPAVIAAVAEHYRCDPDGWRPGRRSGDLARAVAAYLGRQLTGERLRPIADALGYSSPSSVTAACRRVERARRNPRRERDLQAIVRRLERVVEGSDLD